MTTRDPEVGPQGDCIIGVCAERAASDLPAELKRILRSGSPLVIRISADDITEEVLARGDHRLSLDHPTDLVVRKSDFVCGRTVAVGANKAAADLPKEMITRLKNPNTVLKLLIKRIP